MANNREFDEMVTLVVEDETQNSVEGVIWRHGPSVSFITSLLL
jgi:hypothetical protein